jgi:hypothetical protein
MKCQSMKASAITPAHPPTAPPTVIPVFVKTVFGGGVAVAAIEGEDIAVAAIEGEEVAVASLKGDGLGDWDKVSAAVAERLGKLDDVAA